MKKIIGITGGIGSGKSTVLDLLEKNFSAYIIKADDVAKQLMDGREGFYRSCGLLRRGNTAA